MLSIRALTPALREGEQEPPPFYAHIFAVCPSITAKLFSTTTGTGARQTAFSPAGANLGPLRAKASPVLRCRPCGVPFAGRRPPTVPTREDGLHAARRRKEARYQGTPTLGSPCLRDWRQGGRGMPDMSGPLPASAPPSLALFASDTTISYPEQQVIQLALAHYDQPPAFGSVQIQLD